MKVKKIVASLMLVPSALLPVQSTFADTSSVPTESDAAVMADLNSLTIPGSKDLSSQVAASTATASATPTNAPAAMNSAMPSSNPMALVQNANSVNKQNQANHAKAMAAQSSSGSVPQFYSGANNYVNPIAMVDPHTGNVIATFNLINSSGYQGRGNAVNLQLMYSSGNMYTGSRFNLNPGYSFNIPYFDVQNNILHLGDGSTYGGSFNGNTFGAPYMKSPTKLTQTSGTTAAGVGYSYIISALNGSRYYLDSNGAAVQYSDRFGSSIVYHYTHVANTYFLYQIDQLAKDKYSDGPVNTFKFEMLGRQMTITLPNNKTVVYNSQTNAIVDPMGYITQLQLDSPVAYGTAGSRLIGIQTPDGLDTQIAYKNISYLYDDSNNNQQTDSTSLWAVSALSTVDNLTGQVAYSTYTYNGNQIQNYTGYPLVVTQPNPPDPNSPYDPLMESENSSYNYGMTVETLQPTGDLIDPNGNLFLKSTNTYNVLGLLTATSLQAENTPGQAQTTPLVNESMGYLDIGGNTLPPYSATIIESLQPEATQLIYFGASTFRTTNPITNASYNYQGQPIKVTTSDGITTTMSYTNFGLMSSENRISASGTQNLQTNYNYSFLSGNGPEYQALVQNGVVNSVDGKATFQDIADNLIEYDGSGRVASSKVSAGSDAKALSLSTATPGSMTTYTYGDVGDNSAHFNSFNQFTDWILTTTAKGSSANGNNSETITTYKAIDIKTGLTDATIDGNGNEIDYSYDADGRLTSATYPYPSNKNSSQKITYDYALQTSLPNGQKANTVKTTYPNGYITLDAYDAKGDLIYSYDNSNSNHTGLNASPTTLLVTNGYDFLGRLERSTDNQNGLSSTYYYDIQGRLLQTKNADGTTSVTSYNDAATGSNSTVTQYTLAADGTKGPEATDVYNNIGQKTESGINLDLSSNNNYESCNGQSSSTICEAYTYNGIGQLGTTSMKNGNLSITSSNDYGGSGYYTGLLQSSVISDNNGNSLSTNNQFDYLGHSITSATSQNGDGPANGDSYAYNSFGQVEIISDPNKQGPSTQTMGYDANGNQTTLTDWMGNEFTTTYDSNNNPIEIRETKSIDGQSYDLINNYDSKTNLLTSQTLNGKTMTYSYSDDGYLQSITYPNNQSIKYNYNADGTVASIIDVLGNKTSYTYYSMGDNSNNEAVAGNLKSATLVDNKGNQLAEASYSYNSFGEIVGASYQNAGGKEVMDISYSNFNNLQQPTEIDTTTKAGKNSNIISFSNITYDNLGNITGFKASSNADGSGNYNQSYDYDFLNRLSQSNGNKNASYQFDANSNITKISGSQNYDYGYKSYEQLTNYNSKSFSYDDNGNMTEDSENNQYSFNDMNQLLSFNPQNGNKITYGYYPSGELATVSQNGTTITLYYDADGNLINETDNNGNASSYLLGAGREARIYIEKNKDPILSFYVTDLQGSVIGHIDDNGNLMDNQFITYSDYGVSSVGNQKDISLANDPFGYTGEYSDGVSGLLYLRARFMNPTYNSFISMDSYGLPNKYAYTTGQGNPISFTDPTGHSDGAYANNPLGDSYTGYGDNSKDVIPDDPVDLPPALQYVFDGLGMLTGAALCATGVGCIAGGPMIAASGMDVKVEVDAQHGIYSKEDQKLGMASLVLGSFGSLTAAPFGLLMGDTGGLSADTQIVRVPDAEPITESQELSLATEDSEDGTTHTDSEQEFSDDDAEQISITELGLGIAEKPIREKGTLGIEETWITNDRLVNQTLAWDGSNPKAANINGASDVELKSAATLEAMNKDFSYTVYKQILEDDILFTRMRDNNLLSPSSFHAYWMSLSNEQRINILSCLPGKLSGRIGWGGTGASG